MLVHQTLSARRNPFLSLLRFRLLSTLNYISSVRDESLLKVVVVTLLGLTFWLGIFGLAMVGFKFLLAESGMGQFRSHLVPPILSLFFMAITFMLVFSNAVISFSSLFKAPETAFLFALPLRHDTIFLYKMLESLIFSSWAIFAAGLPLMLAYGIQSGAQWWYYPLVCLFTIPFVMLPAGLGALLGLVLTAILPRQRGRILLLLAAVLLIGGAYIGIMLFKGHTRSNQGMEAAVASIINKLAFTRHPLTPNYWMSEAVLAVGEGRAGWAWSSSIFFGALATSAMFTLTLGWFVSGTIYESTYSFASGGGSIQRVDGQTKIEWLLSPILRRYPKVAILLLKDIKTFLRDPAQWSQVLIFFGILVLYIGNLRNFQYPLGEVFYQNLISFLNLGATCMTLATMTSRFVFPMISLEGHRFWILGLLPIQRRDVMMSKFYFSLGGALLLTLTLVTLSNYILRGTTYQFGIQVLTAALLSLSLSGLSVGMGAIFPSFNERNPSKIVSGFGGTLTLIIAIGLVVITVLGEALLCHRFLVINQFQEGVNFESRYGYVFYILMGGVVALNILAAYIPMRLGIKALENVEF